MKVAAIESIPIREPEPRAKRDWWCTSPTDVFLPGPTDGPGRIGREASTGEISTIVVRIRTDDGLEGVGTVGLGSPAAIPLIERHLAPLVLGQNPFDLELTWARMFRSTINIGRKGLVLEAISAIDIALWDIVGKAAGQPVYNLLGGRTRERIRAYVSQSYAKQDLDQVRDEARSYAEEGFTALKMRFGYGPVDGEQGKRKNYALVEAVREAIGPDVELMADAYMGWDVPYAIDMIERLDDLRLKWIEEPVVPDDLAGYARIRERVKTPISGGEHEFTRWGYREMIERGAVDILQPDVNRMGGITEARKVFALASAHDLPVIPHSNQAHNAHLIVSHMNAPLIEVFPRNGVRSGYTFYGELFEGEPDAEGGYVTLSERPGLGIDVREDVLAEYRADT